MKGIVSGAILYGKEIEELIYIEWMEVKVTN